ncbi:MAG: protein kinase [Deltaproteobacteria bacterium]|nr:protein kinase [Deltaproteobacteria bacterium]
MPSSRESQGRFQVLHRIASGGMAEVFLSRFVGPQGFERLVALKKVRARFTEDPRFVERLVSEARIMVRLSHGNICQVLDFGIMDGQYFLAMEHVAGCDLGMLMHGLARLDEAFPPVLAAYVVAEICRGLDYAHRRTDEAGRPLGIVHRDVTPENVLISYDGEVKLTDFGISQARGVEMPAEREGVVLGKAAYLAPEQLAGGRGDARTDVFSVGILLWEMLVGLPLFRRSTDRETIEAVGRLQIQPPSRLRPGIPPELDAITLRALARRPGDRHPAAAALLEDLSRFVALRAPGMTGATLAELVARQMPRRGNTDETLATAQVTVPREVVSLAVDPTPAPEPGMPPALPALPQRPSTVPFEAPLRQRTGRARAVAVGVATFAVVAVGMAIALTRQPSRSLTAVQLGAPAATSPDAGGTAHPAEIGPVDPPRAQDAAPRPGAVPGAPPPSSAPVAVEGAEPPGAPTKAPARGPDEPRVRRTGVERPEPPPGRPPAAGGFINVNATPWGKVYVDGRIMANETPARLPVSAGPHSVKVYFVTAARYSPARQVVIEAGQTRGMMFVLSESP